MSVGMSMRCRVVGMMAGVWMMVAPACAFGQLPQTDIYLVPFWRYGTNGALADTVVNLTSRPGYDSQPSVRYDDTAHCYYTSIGESGQADIWRLDFARGWSEVRPQQVTSTPESEYSPLVTPDGGALTVVRVEADSSQRLVRMSLDGEVPTRLLAGVAGLDKIGYYTWVDSARVVLFVLGEPHSLWLANIVTGEKRELARDIGRCIRAIPWVSPGTISYVQKDSLGSHICEMDVETGRSTPIITMPDPGIEDFEWFSFGRRFMIYHLLCASGGQILYSDWQPTIHHTTPWQTWLDLRPHGLQSITRLAAIHGVDGPLGARRGLLLVGSDEVKSDK